MEIKQKRLSNNHTFTFNEESLNFAFKDKSGSDDFDLNYADFPEKFSISIEQNEWLRNVGILWCLLGCYRIGTALYNELPLSGTGFWFFLGLICLVWYALTKTKYSVFKTEAGNVFIINDKNHDKIIAEMTSRKKSQLLKWYGDINLDNDLENEISKFNWLVKQNVISQEEAEEKIAQVEFAHKSETSHNHQLN
jgi:cbb3-type cytochrome oxidase subunit 3